jgi:hypothetical protein
MMSRNWFIGFYILFVLSSCHKEEPLYRAPVVAKGLQTQTFEMGENYAQQLYFDFESQILKANDFGLWDIGFACNNEPHVIICGGKNVQFSAAKIQNTDFETLNSLDVKSLIWKFDHPEGHIDSMAISNCFEKTPTGYKGSEGQVFILDLGADSVLSKRYVKIQFLSVIGGVYHIQWAYVYDSNSTIHTVKIQTQPEYNYVYYSFGLKNTVENEILPKDQWDIVFTTYKEDVPDATGKIYAYIIRGALINPGKLQVAQIDGSIDFQKFSFADAQKVTFYRKRNEIGYDWKTFDINSGKYTIVPQRFYLVKTENGTLFKLRFIDFYDDQGRKGFPKIAWELLTS